MRQSEWGLRAGKGIGSPYWAGLRPRKVRPKHIKLKMGLTPPLTTRVMKEEEESKVMYKTTTMTTTDNNNNERGGKIRRK